MRSSRDRYGIKTLRAGQRRFVPGKTRDQFRRVLGSYCKRHKDVRRKVFEWLSVSDGVEVRRVI